MWSKLDWSYDIVELERKWKINKYYLDAQAIDATISLCAVENFNLTRLWIISSREPIKPANNLIATVTQTATDCGTVNKCNTKLTIMNKLLELHYRDLRVLRNQSSGRDGADE